MTSKCKTLGLVLMAALALSGVAAQAAAADQFHSLSGTGNTFLTVDSSTSGITFTGGNWKCPSMTGKAQYAGTTSKEFTLTNIVYSSCTTFGLTSHTDMMGCDYLVKGSTATTGVLHIVCPTTTGGITDEITITPTMGGAAVCHIDIPEQTIPLNMTNTAATAGGIPSDVDIAPNSAGITYRVTYIPPQGEKTTLCQEPGLHHEGKGLGSVTLTGFSDGVHSTRTTLSYS